VGVSLAWRIAAAENYHTISNGSHRDGGLGDGSAWFPQSKRKPLAAAPFLIYWQIASVWASVKKKAFVKNIRSCSSSSLSFGFLVVCFHI
jgi:hypothetical protein